MATYTEHLHLTKPAQDDYAEITTINTNMDILDDAYGNLNGKYLPLTGGTMTGNIDSSNQTGLNLSSLGGAKIEMHSNSDTSTYKGCLVLDANNGTDNNRLVVQPNGIITGSRDIMLQAKDNTGLYAHNDGTCGMSNGNATFELNANNNLYFNGGKVSKVFNHSYSDIKKYDITNKSSGLTAIVQGEFSLQIFQDKQTLWTEMYVLVWNSSGDKWLTLKSPVTWASQESTFIVTSVGRMDTYDNYSDNTCKWVDNNSFIIYSRGKLYQMYHFAGYASEVFGSSTASLSYTDETHEMTVQTNAQLELQAINAKLQDINAAAVCTASVDGEDVYTLFKDGNVVDMTNNELNEYHDTLTDRRMELLQILKG